MRKLLSASLAALLLVAPAAVWSATVGSPWTRTIDGVSEVQEGVAITSDGSNFFVAGSFADDFQVNALNGATGADNWVNAADGGAGQVDRVAAVNAEWVRPVAVGTVVPAGTTEQAHARKYDPVLGTTKCTFTTPLAGLATAGSAFNAVAQTPNLVVAGGTALNSDNSWYVQALGTSCDGRWSDIIAGQSTTPGSAVKALAANIFGRIAAAGTTEDTAGHTVWTVRTYDTNGVVKWTKKTSTTGAGNNNSANAVALDGDQVYAAGVIFNAAGKERASIKTYKIPTGGLSWQGKDKPLGYNSSAYNAIALDGTLLVAVGWARKNGQGQDWLVTARDATTGAVLWQALHNELNRKDIAYSVAIVGDYVFVAGEIGQGPDEPRFHVRIYHRNGDGLGGPLLLFQETPLANDSRANASAGQNFGLAPGVARFAATGVIDQGDGEGQAFTKAYLVSP